MKVSTSTHIAYTRILCQNHLKKPADELRKHSMYTHYLDLSMSNRSSQPTLSETFTQIGLAVAEVVDTEVPIRATLAPVNHSSNLIGILRHIDSIALRVGQPSQPSHRRIPSYVSRSLGHTNAEVNPTMPKMCSGSFHVLQRLNNSCAIYAIYTVVTSVLDRWS